MGERREEVGKSEIAIDHVDHPSKKLTNEQIDKIMFSLSLKIKDCLPERGPRFSGVRYERGVIYIECIDEESIYWLRKQVENVVKVIKVPMKATEIQPHVAELIADSYGLDNPSTFLSMLNRQNYKFPTTNWRVIGKKHKNKSIMLLIEIDEISKSRIIDLNGKIFSGFHRAQLKVVDKDDVAKLKKKYHV